MFAAALALYPAMSHADEDIINHNGMTVTIVGVGTGTDGTAYFDLAEAPARARGCTWEYYYIKLDTPAGVATYATLLSAYQKGKKLRRLHFYQSSNPGSCVVNLMEVFK